MNCFLWWTKLLILNNYKLANIFLWIWWFLFQVRQYQPVKYGVFPLLPLSRHRLSMLPYNICIFYQRIFFFIFLNIFRYGEEKSLGARFRWDIDPFTPWRCSTSSVQTRNASRFHFKSYHWTTSCKILCSQKATCWFFSRCCKFKITKTYHILNLIKNKYMYYLILTCVINRFRNGMN